ncbi:MAG TPA: TolC family protein [Opitutaceae bacterium]|nr:TolC family protein [Opitutaceae bacterium]
MILRFTYLALVLLALTGGCAIYHPQPLSPESAAAGLAARSLRDEGLRQFMAQNLGHAPAVWPMPQWDLDALTLAAWYYHPDMAVARAQVATARAEKKVAGERPEPGVSFSPQYTSNPADLSPWTLGYALDLPWETAGKRAKRVAAATAGEKSADYQLAAAAWQVRSRLRTTLLTLWAAQEATTWLDRQLADESALFTLLEHRLAAGEIASVELAQARMTLEQTRLAAEDAHKQLQLARVGLAQAIGVPGPALSDVSVDFHGEVEEPSFSRLPPADELQKQALQARPDILAALADYDTAEANLRLEIARQYPDLNFGPGYTWDQGAKRWSLGVSLTLPVFNRNRGAIEKATADRAASRARFEAVQTRVLGDLENARASFESGCESLRAADELEHQQQAQFAADQSRFNAGEIGRIEFLQSRAQYDAAAAARVNSLVQAQSAFALLQDAVQRPLDGTGPASPLNSPP